MNTELELNRKKSTKDKKNGRISVSPLFLASLLAAVDVVVAVAEVT